MKIMVAPTIEDFKRKGREKGFEALNEEVVLRGLCSGCGLCSAVCPTDAIEYSAGGVPVLKENGRCIYCGLCLLRCPRGAFDWDRIEADFVKGEKDELGRHLRVLSVRPTDESVREMGQDCGVVSSIVKYAFEKGMIDGAILSRQDDRFMGSPFLARSWDEACQASKSKYNISPNVTALRWAKESNLKRVALVGVPCHISAFRKMQSENPNNLPRRVFLAIGIFCSENFSGKMLTEFLTKRGVDPQRITKLDIKGVFKVEVGDEVIEIPLEEMKDEVSAGCLVCRDFSAELADISVGAVGSPDGWCTVITRTERGDEILRAMLDEGFLEVAKLTKPKTLRRMSWAKRLRGNNKILEIMRSEAALPLQSVQLPSELERGGDQLDKGKRRKA